MLTSISSQPSMIAHNSHFSNREPNLSRMNSSKLNRTIVNELMDPESDKDVMDRIETQNNIVENLKDIPNY